MPEPKRVAAIVTEYRRHSVTCACGYTTLAKIDDVPASPFGPRLMSLVALLTGVYHLSRRQAVVLLHDVLGVRLSLGAASAIEERVSGPAGGQGDALPFEPLLPRGETPEGRHEMDASGAARPPPV